MSTVDTDQIRAAVRRRVQQDRVEHTAELTRATLAEATVMAWDATLASCAFAVLTHTEEALTVADFETIKWNKGLENPTWKMFAGDALYERVVPLLRVIKRDFPDIEIVTEEPAVGHNPRLRATESSYLAVRAIRDAALHVGVVIGAMMPAQKVKTLITGQRDADKREIAQHMNLLAPALPVTNYPSRTNNDVRDAIAVGITDLHRRISQP